MQIDDTLVDGIIIQSLKSDVIRITSSDHQDKEEQETLQAILDVLQYYMRSHDYKDFISTIDNSRLPIKHGEMIVSDIEENADGSALVTMELSADDRDFFVSEGINFVLIRAMLECSTGELLEFAKRGKQEMHTDTIIERYNRIRAETEDNK